MVSGQPKLVTIYIRRGEAKERLVSFQPPTDVPQGEVIEHGYAFDGQSVVKSVQQVLPGSDRTLADRLLEVQKDLITWLGRYGYTVEFK